MQRRDALIAIHNTDMSTSLSDHDVNRSDTDVSLSNRLLLFYLHSDVPTSILSSFLSRSLMTTISRNDNSKVSRLGWIQTPFNRVHVTIDTTHEQSQTSRTTYHDPCTRTEEQPCGADNANRREPGQQPGEPV